MVHRGADLLEMACERLARTRAPACIKDSELRYVAVSPAFAAWHEMEPADFPGLTDADLPFNRPNDVRDELERRAVVFGCDSEVEIFVSASSRRCTLRIEQFVSESGDIFLYEHGDAVDAGPVPLLETILAHEQEAQRSGHVSEADAPAFLKVITDALSRIDAGIFILDPDETVVFCNEKMVQLYRTYMGSVRNGEKLRDVLARGIERGLDPTVDPTDPQACALWVERRLASFRTPIFEDVGMVRSGRWMQVIHQRLPNGYVVGLSLDVTDSKEREALLMRQKEEVGLYKAILDALPVPVFVRDENHALIYANEVRLGLAQQGNELTVGLTEVDIFGDEAEAYFEENERVLQTGVVSEREAKMLNREGGRTPILCRVSRADVSNGKRYVVGSLTDITTLKEREHEIEGARTAAEAARRQLLDVMNSIDTGIMVVRQSDLVIEQANERVLSGWRKTPLADLIGRSFLELLDYNHVNARILPVEIGLEAAKQRWTEQIRSGTVPLREVSTVDGVIYVVQGRQIDGGSLVLTYNDITELRHQDRVIDEARASLAETGALMNEALVAMAQGMILLAEGKVRIFNDAVNRLLDLPEEMLHTGADWQELFEYCARRGDFGDDPEAFVRRVTVRYQSGKLIDETFCVDRNRCVRLEAKPTGTNGVIILLTDITELCTRQDELKRLVARAEKADRAKSDFLASVSHEIRTPMNGVLSMAELLSRSTLDTRQKTYVDAIGKSAKSLMTVINDILDFSKLETGAMALRPVNFDPLEAVDDVAALFAAKAEDKGLTLVVRAAAALPRRTRGDAVRFRQIVFNLVNNAVKYTDQGHVEIRLSSGPAVNGRCDVTIEVEDTGKGIEPERLNRIFDKFSSGADQSVETQHREGLGLGLATAEGLVRLFGGTISVDSDTDTGSLFRVVVPFDSIERDRDEDVALPAEGASVLVVDAVAVSRNAIVQMLADVGVDASGAASVDEALDIVEVASEMGLAVDAIVVSGALPRKGARTLVRALKADPRFSAVPVILLTSVLPEGLNAAAEISAEAQLQRPVRTSLLVGTLCELLAVRKNARNELLPAKREMMKAAEPAMPVREVNPDVLVAEDNDINILVYQQILSALGCSFRIAENGKAAVEMWRTLKPRIVLMDISMPVMDGYAATSAIRAEEVRNGLSRTPIIGVTAHLFDNDRNDCIDAGMDDYLAKPISQDHLTSMVETWLSVADGKADGAQVGDSAVLRKPGVNRSA